MRTEEINPCVSAGIEGGVGLIVMHNPPVNALKHELREGVAKSLDRLRAEAGGELRRRTIVLCRPQANRPPPRQYLLDKKRTSAPTAPQKRWPPSTAISMKRRRSSRARLRSLPGRARARPVR